MHLNNPTTSIKISINMKSAILRFDFTDKFSTIYNPQNETEDGNKSKRPKIKTKRDSPQNEAYLRVRFFNRPPYPIFAPKSTRLRRGQG